jgi:hypothetical protein
MNIVTNDITNKYLTQPILNLINQSDFEIDSKYKNTMNIITGPTGLGKTWATFNYIVTELFDNKNLQLVIYTHPTTEIWEDSYKSYITNNSTSNVYTTGEVTMAKLLLEQGKQVFLHLTNQALVVEQSGLDFIEYVMLLISELDDKVAIFSDEVNQWMTSDVSNYKNTMGHKTDVKCSMYKIIDRISSYTPYCFGLTATPQAEQRGEVIPIGNMQYKIINEYPALSMMIGRTKAINEVQYFDITDVNSVYDKFEQFVTKHMEHCESTGKYSSALINVKAGVRDVYTLDTIVKKLQNLLHKYTDVRDTHCIATMTSNDTSLYKTMGKIKLVDKKTREQFIKNMLSDSTNKLMFLIVIEKGKSGLSINNFINYFSFRPVKASDTDSNVITEMTKQRIGRFHRLNTGTDMDEYSKKWGYDLTNYVTTLNKTETENLIELNSYNMYVPDDEGWRQSVEFVKQYCSPSIEMLKGWIKSF